MFRKCYVANCNSLRMDVKLHKFPSNEVNRNRWLKSIGYENILSDTVEKIHICHKHFEKRFVNLNTNRLKCDAYPTLFRDTEISSGHPSVIHEECDFGNSVCNKQNHTYLKKHLADHSYSQSHKVAQPEVNDNAKFNRSEVCEASTDCGDNAEVQSLEGCNVSENLEDGECLEDGIVIHDDDIEDARSEHRSESGLFADEEVAKSNLHEGYLCNGCQGEIIGPRYTCAECADHDLCGECERTSAHPHYALRVPGPRPQNEIKLLLEAINKILSGKTTQEGTDDPVDEIKEEIDDSPFNTEDPFERLDPKSSSTLDSMDVDLYERRKEIVLNEKPKNNNCIQENRPSHNSTKTKSSNIYIPVLKKCHKNATTVICLDKCDSSLSKNICKNTSKTQDVVNLSDDIGPKNLHLNTRLSGVNENEDTTMLTDSYEIDSDTIENLNNTTKAPDENSDDVSPIYKEYLNITKDIDLNNCDISPDMMEYLNNVWKKEMKRKLPLKHSQIIKANASKVNSSNSKVPDSKYRTVKLAGDSDLKKYFKNYSNPKRIRQACVKKSMQVTRNIANMPVIDTAENVMVSTSQSPPLDVFTESETPLIVLRNDSEISSTEGPATKPKAVIKILIDPIPNKEAETTPSTTDIS